MEQAEIEAVGDHSFFRDTSEVGITEYVNENTPILNATIKSRYSDFIVNEIDPDGNLAKLSRDEVIHFDENTKSREETKQPAEENKDDDTGEQGPKKVEITDAAIEVINGLFGDDSKGLIDYIQGINDGVLERTAQFTINHIDDKEKRTKIHQLFKDHLTDFETHTSEQDGERKIIVFLGKELSKNKRKKLDMRTRKEENPHVKLVMMKENIESMQAIHNISKLVKKQPRYFGVAGNKDKRGITFQFLTITFGNIGNIIRAQKDRNWLKKVRIGNLEKWPNAIKLGNLSGNRFSLALRFIEGVTDEQIQENVERMNANGFINYFGMQRFGWFNIMTHTIGKEVIKQQWKEVIHMIISQHPRTGEGKERKDKLTKLVFEDNDLHSALDIVEPRDRLEKVVIQSLMHHKNGYQNAFYKISRNTRIIFIHAYQSYIWNKVTSDRFKLFGRKVLIGDLVSSESDLGSDIDEEEETKQNEKHQEVTVVTEQNINNYTLFDVVMPLIGKSVKFPENEDLKNMYFSYMEKDGITMSMFEAESMESGCAHGAYRHIVASAKDIEWDTVIFSDKNQDLLNPYYLTDGSELKIDPPKDDDEKHQALRIKFSLPPSSYATMFVRELTHHNC